MPVDHLNMTGTGPLMTKICHFIWAECHNKLNHVTISEEKVKISGIVEVFEKHGLFDIPEISEISKILSSGY